MRLLTTNGLNWVRCTKRMAIRLRVRNCILATCGTCSTKILLNSCRVFVEYAKFEQAKERICQQGVLCLALANIHRLAPYLWSFVRVQLHGHERGSSFFIQCAVLSLPKEVRHFIAADIFVAGLFSLERFNACEFHTILPSHNIAWKFRKVQFSASEIRNSITKRDKGCKLPVRRLVGSSGSQIITIIIIINIASSPSS